MSNYSRSDLLRILGIHARQLSVWERRGLTLRKNSYSFDELHRVKTLRDLSKAKVGTREIQASVDAMRALVSADQDKAISEATLDSTGRRIVFRHDGLLLDPLRRQLMLEFDLSEGTIVPTQFDFSAVERSQIIPVEIDFTKLLYRALEDKKEFLLLSPRRFEEVVAEIFSRLGYTVELTAQTRDHGRDIVAVKRAEINLRVLIECKRYAEHRKVDLGIVRSLYGMTMHEGATKGILATTSSFTTPAKRFFDEHLWKLEPRDYEGIKEWIQLAPQKSSS